jgi:hypothetical protein
MHTLLASLVASSLLLHAVLGCCWHYGQESSRCCESQDVADADHHEHDCCGDRDDDTEPLPCNGGPHCHNVCNYLPVQKSQLDQGQLNVLLDFVAVVLPATNVHVVAAHGIDRLYELDTGLPLRLHLVHQILLI